MYEASQQKRSFLPVPTDGASCHRRKEKLNEGSLRQPPTADHHCPPDPVHPPRHLGDWRGSPVAAAQKSLLAPADRLVTTIRSSERPPRRATWL